MQVFQVDPSPRLTPYAYETAAIRAAGGELVLANCASEAEVIDQAKDAEIILVSWSRHVTPAVMDALPKLRLIARWGVGYDMIDADAATARGIAVVNTPTYCGDEVAEHAIALLFACARGWLGRTSGCGRGCTNPLLFSCAVVGTHPRHHRLRPDRFEGRPTRDRFGSQRDRL